MRLQSMLTAGTALSLMGLILAVVGKAEAVELSRVTDISPEIYDLSSLTVFDDALYFSAYDRVHGSELFKYDGTTASLVADIVPGIESFSPQYLTVFDNALYFSADDKVNGYELWKYDGTTVSLADINPGSEGSYPYGFTIFNKALYFSAGDRLNGREIWKLEPDEPTSVPEPASALGLLAFSALGTGSMLKRKLQKAAQLGIVDSETSD
jgi:ELWxxDGT repeat protein